MQLGSRAVGALTSTGGKPLGVLWSGYSGESLPGGSRGLRNEELGGRAVLQVGGGMVGDSTRIRKQSKRVDELAVGCGKRQQGTSRGLGSGFV